MSGWSWIWWPLVNSLAPSSTCAVTVNLGPRGQALSTCLVTFATLSHFLPFFPPSQGCRHPAPHSSGHGLFIAVCILGAKGKSGFLSFATLHTRCTSMLMGEQGPGFAWSPQRKVVAPSCRRPCWRSGVLWPWAGEVSFGCLLACVQSRGCRGTPSHPLP